MRFRVRERSEPIPVSRAIQWLPSRGVDHVLASLRAGAGRRQIFVPQAILQQLDDTAGASPTSLRVGLLLGGLYSCPVSGARYSVIESLASVATATRDLRACITDLNAALESHSKRATAVIGWYCARGDVDDDLRSDEDAVYKTVFTEPWQTALLLAARSSGVVSGTFYQRDSLDGHAFRAPFFEMLDAKQPGGGVKGWG